MASSYDKSSFHKETAHVVSESDGYVWLSSITRSGCHSCDANQVCGTGLLSHLFGRRRFYLKVKNTLGVKAGDDVLISIPERSLLMASLLLYLFPVFAMFVTAVIAQSMLMSEAWVVLWSIFGLLAGFAVARLLCKRLETGATSQITLLAKVEPNMVLQIEQPT
ncbi:SoxR reducing system RseC family protein [Pleionea mediterranea]|uniref:RseC/MucC-like positive regulator of sigma(E) n=1 Tax=Pleionea mediterranea TaxID=523701 RepID=A0A316G0U2_9GAMM|nr:SoxR reducing system RseC family protein [Pleionea mediterranea]PWK54469.1 RseC/MucC-like positive regulator of sigma(E) [Pleionea mediterranea]